MFFFFFFWCCSILHLQIYTVFLFVFVFCLADRWHITVKKPIRNELLIEYWSALTSLLREQSVCLAIFLVVRSYWGLVTSNLYQTQHVALCALVIPAEKKTQLLLKLSLYKKKKVIKEFSKYMRTELIYFKHSMKWFISETWWLFLQRSHGQSFYSCGNIIFFLWWLIGIDFWCVDKGLFLRWEHNLCLHILCS